jgi:glycerol-3-phosphate dehydrogenase
MPIAHAVGAVLYDGLQPADMVLALMTRGAKSEFHGLS